MATLHPRLNITFDAESAAFLAELAKRKHQSISATAKALILDGLERQEDMVLSALAEKRDSKTVKRVKHKDAWK